MLSHEFMKLKDSVRRDIEGVGESRKAQTRDIDSTTLWVYRTAINGSEVGVTFRLISKNSIPDHILVTDDRRKEEFTVTLVLNEKGKCRYQIDGESEYLRWQVVRRALEPLLFG